MTAAVPEADRTHTSSQMAALSEYAMTALQRSARACARSSVRSSAHAPSPPPSASFTERAHTVPPMCTMKPGGNSVMVRKGYSSMSKLLLFIEGRKMAPPPLPTLPADVFNEPPLGVTLRSESDDLLCMPIGVEVAFREGFCRAGAGAEGLGGSRPPYDS